LRIYWSQSMRRDKQWYTQGEGVRDDALREKRSMKMHTIT